LHRINNMIRVPEVRLLDENSEQMGVVTSDRARELARERGLDLVEISPMAVPPVCRIMDYGKFKYEQKKRTNESKKKQHNIQVKELRLRPQTGEHDVAVRLRQAREFLLAGDKVAVIAVFRGREVTHPEIGLEALRKFAEELKDVGRVERTGSLEGKRITMILAPSRRQA
jgi:translation initiation factor IF-3